VSLLIVLLFPRITDQGIDLMLIELDGLEAKVLLAKSRNTEDESKYSSIESQAGYNDGEPSIIV